MDVMHNITTISVSKTTRNRLSSLGTKDSTFEEIISKLIENNGKEVSQKFQQISESDNRGHDNVI